MSLKWTILGSGAGQPSPSRNKSGHILEYDNRLILFDCGSGVTSSFLQSGFDEKLLDAIIISHTHPDHISDLPMFIQMLYLYGKEGAVELFLPSEAIKPMQAYLDACYLFREKFKFNLIVSPIEKTIKLLDNRITVNAVLNEHLLSGAKHIVDYHYPNKMLSYSFMISTDSGKRILYSADLASLADVKDYLKNLDLLVIETTHIDISELNLMLKSEIIKKTLLAHIADEDEEKIRRFVESTGTPDIIMAEDNLGVDI